MIRLLSILVVTTFSISDAAAQVRQFPYQARIVDDEAYVRSGAGDAFYPTQVLKKDAVVTVRRHDPGGWFMIEPPKGSFSWLPEKYVRQTAAQSGELTESNVVVFVGSSFGDETNVWQRKLMAGEKVTILDQRTLDTLSGPREMFRIEPPAREYRWVPGTAVIPEGEQQRSQHDRDPYAVPSNIVKRQHEVETPLPIQPEQQPSGYSPSHQLVRLQKIRSEQRELREIDQKFRTMILSPPSNWDLNAVENDYRDLQQNATYQPLAGQIDLRYPAIRRYRQQKAKLEELNQLTSATEKRDADLLATQFGMPSGNGFPEQRTFTTESANPFALQDEFSMQVPPDQIPSDQIPSDSNPFSFESIPFPDANNDGFAMVSNPSSNAFNIPQGSRYIGAGYVTRGTGQNAQDYILTSGSGKILAHLIADGPVDLESRVGQSVGLHGKRYYDDKVKADRIEVSGLESVRLR